MPNAQCPMPNAQCPMPNAQCSMLNAQWPMPSAQCSISNLVCRDRPASKQQDPDECERGGDQAAECGVQPRLGAGNPVAYHEQRDDTRGDGGQRFARAGAP